MPYEIVCGSSTTKETKEVKVRLDKLEKEGYEVVLMTLVHDSMRYCILMHRKVDIGD